MAEKDYQFDNDNAKPNGREEKRKKKDKRKKKLVIDSSHAEEEVQFQEKTSSKGEASRESSEGKAAGSVKRKKREPLLKEKVDSEDKGVAAVSRGECDDGKRDATEAAEEENVDCGGDEREEKRKNKRKRRLLEEAAVADKRGVCYLSRIPPHMDPFKLRQLLSQFGDIQRIYLTPENPAAQVRRKPGGRRQEQGFSEGWVEFSDKRIAKRVANMLNGEQIGGRKRSSFYYDLWNIKYLSKFKWDDLTEEIAYKSAIREQKLALEISAAKRERDFYLSKVDKARALSSIEERLKKKQKLQEESGTHADIPVSQAPKIVRKFAQKKPVEHNAAEAKPRLSKDILAGVFGGS